MTEDVRTPYPTTNLKIRRIHTKFRCPKCGEERMTYNQFWAIPATHEIFCSKCDSFTVHEAVEHLVRLSPTNSEGRGMSETKEYRILSWPPSIKETFDGFIIENAWISEKNGEVLGPFTIEVTVNPTKVNIPHSSTPTARNQE